MIHKSNAKLFNLKRWDIFFRLRLLIMKNQRIPKNLKLVIPPLANQESPNENLLGFFGLLYKVSQRHKQKALKESGGQKTKENSK